MPTISLKTANRILNANGADARGVAIHGRITAGVLVAAQIPVA